MAPASDAATRQGVALGLFAGAPVLRTWALIYGALDIIQPGSFVVGAIQDGTSDPDPAPHFADMDPMLYYSLVTLSTLGYGNSVAVTRAARSLSALEAVVGQLYVAVVVPGRSGCTSTAASAAPLTEARPPGLARPPGRV